MQFANNSYLNPWLILANIFFKSNQVASVQSNTTSYNYMELTMVLRVTFEYRELFKGVDVVLIT